MGNKELGNDYFKYLEKSKENEKINAEEELKEKLKNNPQLSNIVAIKKIETLLKIQENNEDYLNHVQSKVFKSDDQKLYFPKLFYKSVFILPNIQKKAE